MNHVLDGLRRHATAILALCLFASTTPAFATGAVKVGYVDPKGFTDVGDQERQPTDRERDAILAQLTTFLQKRAASHIPDGSTLTITVKDLDRAGAFEVWRGPEANHIRLLKEIYPPRIKLSYTLVDAEGRTLSSGDRDLLDQMYLTGIIDDRQDPLRYEKRMLARWIDRDFK